MMRMHCAPNSATTWMQLRGEHHCIPFQLRMQRKDGSFNGCRFCAPGKCTPSVSPKYHCGEGGDADALRPQFCDYMDTAHYLILSVCWLRKIMAFSTNIVVAALHRGIPVHAFTCMQLKARRSFGSMRRNRKNRTVPKIHNTPIAFTERIHKGTDKPMRIVRK